MKAPLIMAAGAKGAVGSTVAVAVTELRNSGDHILPWMTTSGWVRKGLLSGAAFAGWDGSSKTMTESISGHGVLVPDQYQDRATVLNGMSIRRPPAMEENLPDQVRQISADMRQFATEHPHNQPVFVNLLPACAPCVLDQCGCLGDLYRQSGVRTFPDLAYTLAALENSVPIVNFTSNALETSLLIQEAVKEGCTWCGRDGKTGQTYLKLVMASALKVRHLFVDGWYSLNILGNEDGRNLSDPNRASGKLANKTDFLNSVLGYPVGKRYGQSTHKVAIEYYPPRGDRKEAWDVIDFTGIFGMPMSIRINSQLRDSILAAPMVLDLAVWMAALKAAGRSGFIPELTFYFKKAPLPDSPVTFQEQVAVLQKLERFVKKQIKLRKSVEKK